MGSGVVTVLDAIMVKTNQDSTGMGTSSINFDHPSVNPHPSVHPFIITFQNLSPT
ncbi:hypothetical protein HanIR_Chr02g0083761 [Helianthus annuus]|nr:hypothetical protein HanIR_Chr02g0083761 [Helianthus annuus]